ncbi:hypothetical protein JYU34_009999 [Plutella xylostella]|uniref:Uncharacterized protein n=1 Tax=Plutella xylostella TaxID=51655 RepID=A0ABQ7Q6C0_PLUXY|nr:hypothetical protein JYU34_016039 [Plutella xylostella]KAG7304658.1 hypothetical protein JYU34_009999 [Plutella xylostella]
MGCEFTKLLSFIFRRCAGHQVIHVKICFQDISDIWEVCAFVVCQLMFSSCIENYSEFRAKAHRSWNCVMWYQLNIVCVFVFFSDNLHMP